MNDELRFVAQWDQIVYEVEFCIFQQINSLRLPVGIPLQKQQSAFPNMYFETVKNLILRKENIGIKMQLQKGFDPI